MGGRVGVARVHMRVYVRVDVSVVCFIPTHPPNVLSRLVDEVQPV